MANGLFGFKVEEDVTKDLENNIDTPITKVIKETFGPLESVEHIGSHYKKAVGDIKYNGYLVELKATAGSNGTLSNLSYAGLAERVGLPPFPFYKYNDFVEERGRKTKRRGKNAFSKSEAKDISLSDMFEALKEFDEVTRRQFMMKFYNALMSDDEKLARFIKYVVGKEEIDKGIPDMYLVFNHVENKVKCVYLKEEIESLKNVTEIKLTPNGINFGKFRVQLAWKNHVGFNLALYVFIN